MPKVTRATEEAGEQIKWVVRATATVFTLAVLGEAFMPVLVVDAPRFGFGEGFVGVCYLNEFLVRGVIATGRKEMISWAEMEEYGLRSQVSGAGKLNGLNDDREGVGPS